MRLISAILGRYPACEYYFISYKQGNAGISSISLKTKKGYMDLLNNCLVDGTQIDFKRFFVRYVEGVLSYELISKSKVKELAKAKMDKFNQEKCDFIKKQNEAAEKERILPIHAQ